MVFTGCLGPVTKLPAIDAVRFPETSDPSVVRVGDTYYVYGSNNHLRAPVFVTKDISRAYALSAKNSTTHEGMPSKPPWAASATQLWAPTVGEFGGRWVMFFSADRVNPPQPNNPQCIGRAWASSPAGPFVPEPSPWNCGIGGAGGALDPQLFTDTDGTQYLLVALGDTETPLHTIRLDGAANAAAWPAPLLSRQHPWEYHFIEQPAMVWDPVRRNYILTYSAGRWFEAGYSIGIARCAAVTGPCFSDPSGPWVASSNGRSGPGAMSFFTDVDGATRAIFSTFQAGAESTNGGRSASVYYVGFDPSMELKVVK
ncbi:MAG: family 43 glycosylhydrolase [Microthrixaceae bacterium]